MRHSGAELYRVAVQMDETAADGVVSLLEEWEVVLLAPGKKREGIRMARQASARFEADVALADRNLVAAGPSTPL